MHTYNPGQHLGHGGRRVSNRSLSYMRQRGWGCPLAAHSVGVPSIQGSQSTGIWCLCTELLWHTEVLSVLLKVGTHDVTQTQHGLCKCQGDKQPLLREVFILRAGCKRAVFNCRSLTPITPRGDMTFHSGLLVELGQLALVSVKYSNSEEQITPLLVPRTCQFKPFGLNPRLRRCPTLTTL